MRKLNGVKSFLKGMQVYKFETKLEPRKIKRAGLNLFFKLGVFIAFVIPNNGGAQNQLNLGLNSTPLFFAGKTAQTELTKLVVQNLFNYLNKAIGESLFDNLARKKNPVRFTRVRPYVIRSSAHFNGTFWTENQRVKEINARESHGALVEDITRSWVGTGFNENTNSSNGGAWLHKSNFDNYDLIQGDDEFTPKVFIDGEEYTEEAFFKDRNFSLHHFKSGETNDASRVVEAFGNDYDVNPVGNYTFEGKSLNWQASYQFMVDAGLVNDGLHPKYNFRKATTLPVRVFYQLADIDLALVERHDDIREIQILLRKQKVIHWKDKNPTCLKEGQYRVKLLTKNTQLLRNKCYGEGVAYEAEVDSGLQFWKEGPVKYYEEFLEVTQIEPSSVIW